jgi:hypothetical protein
MLRVTIGLRGDGVGRAPVGDIGIAEKCASAQI